MTQRFGLGRLREPTWGGGPPGRRSPLRGETGTVPVFACGRYELRLVDDEHIACVVQDIGLGFEDTSWSIDDDLTICANGWAD